jgi:hypothetical protein
MSWKSVRLELARTPQAPEGSAARAFLVHLPLDANGRVDEAALRAAPAEAEVHRAFEGERTLSGYVIETPSGWAFSYRPGEEDDELVYHLENHPIRLGEYVTITEPDGRQLPFRVAALDDPA